MIEEIKERLFSFTGVSIFVGVVGFLSGLVTIFIDVNKDVSAKWLLLVILISLIMLIVLLKTIYDLSNKVVPLNFYENPIKYIEEEGVFIIRRNDNFLNNILVGCYATRDEVDRLAYIGFVHLVQDKLIQIKIQNDYGVLQNIPRSTEDLKNIIIRPVIPISAFSQINAQGEQ